MRDARARRAALLGLAIALAGPAAAQVPRGGLGPDSLPPLPDSLRVYGGTLAVARALPDLAPPPGARPLSLEEAVAVALERDPALAITALEAARAANDATLGNAGFLPTVDAEAGIAGSATGLGAGGDGEGGQREAATATAGAVADYTVFDGGRRRATLRRLRAEALRAALDTDADAEALAFAVTAAYLDVIRLERLAEALVEAVAVSEDRLRIEEGRVRLGAGADIDAARALADLNADRAALLRQAVNLTAARAELGGLLALPDPAAVEATDTLALGAPPPVAALLAGLDENPRVLALQAGERAAAEALREVRAAYWPTVGATAGAGVGTVTSGFVPGLPRDPAFEVRYGLTARLPIFDAGERGRLRENARIRVRQAELATADALNGLRADAARLADAVRGYRELAELEEQNVAIARQNVRVALAQYQLGFTTPVDLRLVQLALLDAEGRRVEAVFLARLAEAELRLVAGDLLPPRAE